MQGFCSQVLRVWSVGEVYECITRITGSLTRKLKQRKPSAACTPNFASSSSWYCANVKDYAFLTSLKFHTHQFANWEKNSSTYAINWAKLPQSLWARDVKCRLCKRCLAANLSSPNSWKGYNWLNWRFWEMPTHQKSETFGAGYVCKLGIMDLWTLGRGAPRTCRL